MIELAFIGIGTGNPDHVTLSAIRALNDADVVLLPRKGEAKADLVDLRRMLCERLLEPGRSAKVVEFDLPTRRDSADYLMAVEEWHTAIATVWGEMADTYLPDGGRAALMIWGDPSLYDSSLRIAERLSERGKTLEVRVIPGITSIQVLTAEHRIPLNALSEPVLITTGRRLRERGWPVEVPNVAVMLDSGSAFDTLSPKGIYIWWGAYLGMDKQCLIKGWLSEVGSHITARRAKLREENGWIMDVYLLAKP
ncbi:precorrin-6A synthase (deacetylating) [Marinimicrobium locisalis]|uniref:precorrin-6A synthase (deacetylating) n=1 Tax=Marinimicrobium locisalis TaxID=546022 RepID=UPI003221D26E